VEETLLSSQNQNNVHTAANSSIDSRDAKPCLLCEASFPTVYNPIHQTKAQGDNADNRLRSRASEEKPQASAGSYRRMRFVIYSIKSIPRGAND